MPQSIWQQPPVIPRPLGPNDRARIAHVAGAVDEQMVLSGRAILDARGVRTAYDPNANAPDHYLAAPDAQRLLDLQRGLDDDGVRALLCARGGYGSMRLLDHLAPIDAPARFPWVVGYSDITALHLWCNAQGVASIHGPLVSGFARYGDDGGEELDELQRLLQGGTPRAFGGLRPLHGGRATGRLIGGNLSLIQAMIGTPWLPHLDGAILLLEEIAEPAYRVDRMLQSLLIGGRARGLRGIIFGDLTGCHGLDARMTPGWLQAWTQAFGCPVAMGLPVGHGARNLPLILGIDYSLDVDAGTLSPLPPADAHTHAVPTPSTAGDAPPARHINAEEAPMGAGYIAPRSVAPSRLVETLTEMLHVGACTGLQLVASHRGAVTHAIAMGTTAVLDDAAIAPVTPHTRFDLASVTKAVSTAILTHQLIDERRLDLEDRIPKEISGTGARLTELLAHRSGLPAWERLYDDARTQAAPRDWLLNRLRALPLERRPNTACVYSDPGYILLGRWLEQLTGESLDALFAARIAAPLGLTRTGFRALDNHAPHRGDFAATEWCPWRGETLQGVVHDEHAQLLGGVAGHAGLFSTALEVDRIARALLDASPALLTAEAVTRMWSKPDTLTPGDYTLGWDTPSVTPSNAGSLMAPASTVGHLGYAGTSLWIDRQKGVTVTLLTNRVHPTRDAQMIRRFRPQVHDLVMRELGYTAG